MLNQRRLGSQGLTVSELGLGCMGMSHAYGDPDDGESIATIHRAIDLGCTFFDIAEVATPAQIALAWLLEVDPDVVPIPGTKRRTYLDENLAAAQVRLSQEDVVVLDDVLQSTGVSGQRYGPAALAMINR